jgi:cyanophycinase
MVEKGGRGPVVVVGAVPLDKDERPPLFTRLGAASATGLVIDQNNADSKAVHDQIAAARVVFIRGGAQDRYVRWWKGTGTARAIAEVWKSGGVVGGTSAGCAVLGEVVYDALHGSLSAREALSDARHEHLSLTTGFLDLAPGVLFDTHFTERARLARLPVMMAIAREDLHRDLLGVGVDPRTALCIGPDHVAEIRGEGAVTFLSWTDRSRDAVTKGKPPAATGLTYTQLCAGYRYDLSRREVVRRPGSVAVRTPDPDKLDPPTRDLTVDGGDASAAGDGAYTWSGAEGLWLTGGLKIEPGRAVFRDLVLATNAWPAKPADSMAGPQSALAEHPGLIAVWIGPRQSARLSPAGWLDALSRADDQRSILVLDSRPASAAGRGPEPRRAPAVEGAVLHLLAPGWSLDLDGGAVIPGDPED